TQKISLENVKDDNYKMRFGTTKLPRFLPNSGAYVKADAGGSQILINFRNRRKPFHLVSLTEVLTGAVKPELIRGKIVLIGMTSPSAKDYVNSSAIDSENPALIYGVEIQAHIVSQLVSTALDNRPMINVLPEIWEYLWIFSWGLFGVTLGGILISPWKILTYITIGYIGLVGICYGLIIIGWWVPFIPAFLVLGFNYSAVLVAFYKHDEILRSRIQERQLIIDQTFDAIHSYPLQTLNILLREVQSQNQQLSPQDFVSKLQQLNQELRSVYDLVRREVVSESCHFHLREEEILDMQEPLHEVLSEVYDNVVERNYNYFDAIKFKVLDFQAMDERNLTIAQKRSICRFLEEALRNVEKYAIGTTKLEVICILERGRNVIRVVDNGLKIEKMADLSSHSGFGTRQAKNLAKQLGGEFKRYPHSPKGMVCQLTWSRKKSWFW
ncbi:MAG: CHASE2 domain-containing protein, partial [Scytonema sp. PMC 1069.18]|nr:CHASE2 domain-containing protein [Scytonema sp. PMC 1069.18]